MPLDQTVCAATIRLPRMDMRPPCSALASIGSTSVPRRRVMKAVTRPNSSPPRHGDYEGPKRVERNPAGQPLAGIEAEEKLMHEPDRFAHGGDRKAGDRADDHGQHDHARFTRAHDRAQSMRHFERAAEQTHLEQIQAGGPRHWLKFHDASRLQALQTNA